MIADAPVLEAGYQGGCIPNPAETFVATIDTGPNDALGSRAYAAWVELPAGTAYVTYSYGPERWWQRPLDGVTYFATDATPKHGGEPLVARAFAADGRQVGEISRTPIQAAGQWQWF
jgi:hypothetical protein